VTAVTDLAVYACNAAEFAAMLDVAPSVAERVMAAAAARRVANRELCQAA
jgi:CRP-like cAMP-binding protein